MPYGVATQGGGAVSAGQRRRAVLAFGGGRRAVVKSDYRPRTRTLLRAGERVRVFDDATGLPHGSVRAFRERPECERRFREQPVIVPLNYLNLLNGGERATPVA